VKTWAISVLFVLLAPAITALGQRVDAPPPPYLKDVGIDQKLDAQVPLELQFVDDTGTPVRLSDVIHDRPVILTLVYYECPMLCTMVLNDLNRSMRTLPFNIGKEFDVLTVSFDPSEKSDLAAAKKTQYVRQYDRPGAAAGWHFLTGDAAAIKQLTNAVGFRYAWDQKTQEFAHASGIVVLTPQGKVSRYFYGIDYAPSDLRLSLLDAGQGKIGGLADVVLQYCFHYNPATGKYSLAIMNIIRALGLMTVGLIAVFIVRSIRKERRT
jgi:protein SCO1/2